MKIAEILDSFYYRLNKAMPGLREKIFIRAEELSNNVTGIFCQFTTSISDEEKDEAKVTIQDVAEQLAITVTIK